MSLRMGVLVVPFLLVLFGFVAGTADAAARLATPADCDILTNRHQIPCTVGVTSYDPDDPAIGQNAERAKTFLYTKSEVAKAEIDGLNSEFACRLANMLQNAPREHVIKIPSAWRSPEHQARVWSGGRNTLACPPGRAGDFSACPHVNGRAADLRFNGAGQIALAVCRTNEACKWAHDNAGRFGLIFPLMPGVSRSLIEPWHIELNRSVASVPGTTRCGDVNAGANAAPSSLFNQAGTNQPLGLGNQFRNNFGYQQPILAPQPTLPAQPYAQQQSIFGAFNPTPTPVTGNSAQVTNTNTNTNVNSNTSSSTSVADQLLNLALGTTSVATSGTNATSVPIVISGANAGTIASTQGSGNTQVQLPNSGTLQPIGQQTFVTGDLNGQTPVGMTQTQNSQLFQTLGTLKKALTLLLDYLRPFNAGYKLRPTDQTVIHGD